MLFNIQAELLYLAIAILLFWNILLSIWILKIWEHYNKFTKGTGTSNLTDALNKVLEEISKAKELRKRSRNFIQKVNILRFNPFKDVGGDQSFIIALLDEDKNGIVISSLHSRENTRWFAKRVVEGKGVEHKLSKEEQKVVNGK